MREGLKLQEVHSIAKQVQIEMAEGASEDVAYHVACKAVTGVHPDTLKKWKGDIVKLSKGEKTGLDPLPPTPKPGTGYPGTTAKVAAELREENEKLTANAKDANAEIERLRAENENLKKKK